MLPAEQRGAAMHTRIDTPRSIERRGPDTRAVSPQQDGKYSMSDSITDH